MLDVDRMELWWPLYQYAVVVERDEVGLGTMQGGEQCCHEGDIGFRCRYHMELAGLVCIRSSAGHFQGWSGQRGLASMQAKG
jgi:hypothetical protein